MKKAPEGFDLSVDEPCRHALSRCFVWVEFFRRGAAYRESSRLLAVRLARKSNEARNKDQDNFSGGDDRAAWIHQAAFTATIIKASAPTPNAMRSAKFDWWGAN
jgi:hypothetical protein